MSLNENDKTPCADNPLLAELDRIIQGYGVDDAARRDEAALDELHSGKVVIVPLDTIAGKEQFTDSEITTKGIRAALIEKKPLSEIIKKGSKISIEERGVTVGSLER